MPLTANTVLRPIKPAKTGLGVQGEAPMWEHPVKVNTVVTIGDVLILSAGYATVGADEAGGDTIIGIAAESMTPGAAVDEVTEVIRYYPALPGVVFIGHVVADESGGTDETAAYTSLLVAEGLGLTATAGLWVLDQASATTGDCVRIKDFALQQIYHGTLGAGLYLMDRNQVVANAVLNPLVEFTFIHSAWNTATTPA